METDSRGSSEVSGWVGWQYFAATLMMLAGIFQSIAGLTAMFQHRVFLVSQNQLIVLGYWQWGLAHLILGILLFVSAFSLFAGHIWGRVIGIFVAGLSAIANFAFIEAYPWWSLTIIIIDIFVIYAIAVHGGEVRRE